MMKISAVLCYSRGIAYKDSDTKLLGLPVTESELTLLENFFTPLSSPVEGVTSDKLFS